MPSTEEGSLEERPSKRVKTTQSNTQDGPADQFASGLLASASAEKYAQAYSDSGPYHHSLIPQLFQDELVRSVRSEIKANLVFTEKETDIYKVRQTGDLANLDGLEGEDLSKLASVSRLRNALYSDEFRSFLRKVTGVGPLSGKKIDMSINNYTQGCHLLNHDDVIGTRSVSYILYLPDPDEPWQPAYGGALELYPVKTKGIPVDEPSLILPPSWNQFIMFAVQPGHSFHSVEEVVAEGKERLSISGWFHVAQEGEEGFAEDANAAERAEEEHAKSTLEQLLANTDEHFVPYGSTMTAAEELSEDDKAVLGELINPQYLNLRTLVQVNDKFCEDSHIQLSQVLRDDVAAELRTVLAAKDAEDEIDGRKMTPHGTGIGSGWQTHGPPHRQRFMMLDPSSIVTTTTITTTTTNNNNNATDAGSGIAIGTVDDGARSASLLARVERCLCSDAFRKWLSLVTSLVPESHHVKARRFRPGLDYTLATSNDRPRIEVNLCLTVPAEASLWESGEVGGYLCFMAPHEDEDAAIYRGGGRKNEHHAGNDANDGEDGKEEEEEEEEDAVLLTANAAWNEMTVVMRDPGILSFTKYVAVKAAASRWDCAAEYAVRPDEEEEEEEEEEQEASDGEA